MPVTNAQTPRNCVLMLIQVIQVSPTRISHTAKSNVDSAIYNPSFSLCLGLYAYDASTGYGLVRLPAKLRKEMLVPISYQ